MKKLSFFIRNIIRLILGFLLNSFIKRDSNILLFACRTFQSNDMFLHNTKFLYLNTSLRKDIKAIWLSDNAYIEKEMKKRGYNIYSRKSLKGIYYSLKAKYWFTDFGVYDVMHSYFGHNAVIVNLWHGIPLKKIGFDDSINYFNPKKYNPIIYKIWNSLRIKHNVHIVNSEYEQSCYQTAFLTDKEKNKILGSPRLDVLLHDIPNAEMFMEEDFNNIKKLKTQGKKLFIYMPTFRDTGKDISSWLKSDKLKEFLHNNNTILVCKLHPFDKNSLDFELSEDFYKMDSDSDVYPILKYTDALITDYSSVYFDYLLLDKPILYYSPDLEEYQEKCRGFYEPYENLTAGAITQTEQELFDAMQNVIDGVDNYKEQRKALRDRMFKYQDGRNCERVVEWIRSLDK